ncbi:MAG: alpha/beta hydrolase [Gammaproteobacteria bacterium]|jgi:pimeloyl-ACP methyl ester carboxylesterase|nr:alpha/beta hydrolase [Gammaproteobacteria bacterium]
MPKPSSGREAVVLLHGLWMTRNVMALLGRRLAAASPARQTHLFGYPSMRAGMAQNMEALLTFIAGLDADTVHLVGHSLGGVLILNMLNRCAPPQPGRVVCLGSPLRGSATASRLQELPGARVLVGESLEQVLARPLPDWQGQREVGVIAGSRGMGLGRLLRRLDGPNDGTVSVSETCLPGISDHLVMDVSHTGLVLSREVAIQTDFFLHRGHFLRD